MLPHNVPFLPGYLTTVDVQYRLGFKSRQAAIDVLLGDVLPPDSVFRVANGYVVREAAFDAYIRSRAVFLREREESMKVMGEYQQLRAKVKAWADARGLPFPKRGRMSESLVMQYQVAHMGDQLSAARTLPRAALYSSQDGGDAATR